LFFVFYFILKRRRKSKDVVVIVIMMIKRGKKKGKRENIPSNTILNNKSQTCLDKVSFFGLFYTYAD